MKARGIFATQTEYNDAQVPSDLSPPPLDTTGTTLVDARSGQNISASQVKLLKDVSPHKVDRCLVSQSDESTVREGAQEASTSLSPSQSAENNGGVASHEQDQSLTQVRMA